MENWLSEIYAVCFKKENEVFRNGKTTTTTIKQNPLELLAFL